MLGGVQDDLQEISLGLWKTMEILVILLGHVSFLYLGGPNHPFIQSRSNPFIHPFIRRLNAASDSHKAWSLNRGLVTPRWSRFVQASTLMQHGFNTFDMCHQFGHLGAGGRVCGSLFGRLKPELGGSQPSGSLAVSFFSWCSGVFRT